MDAAEYKNIVLGLILLKYTSYVFQAKYQELLLEKDEGADPESRDEYTRANIFGVPKEARWANPLANSKQPSIGTLIDDSMIAIER